MSVASTHNLKVHVPSPKLRLMSSFASSWPAGGPSPSPSSPSGEGEDPPTLKFLATYDAVAQVQDPREARRRVRGSGSRVVVEVCGGGCGEEVAVVAGFRLCGLGREDGDVVVRIGDGEGGGRRRGCGREGKVKGEEQERRKE